MPIKNKQKNKKNKISKNRAVHNTAQSKIENRTNTIKVNVVSNIDTIENKKAIIKSQKKEYFRVFFLNYL